MRGVQMSHAYEVLREEALQDAAEDVRAGVLSRHEACRVYGVPRTTLRRRLQAVGGHVRAVGHPAQLPSAVERGIAAICCEFAERNLALPAGDLSYVARKVAAAAGVTGFKGGKDWRHSFLKRNPDIVFRSPRQLSKERFAALTPEKAVSWINLLGETYTKVFGCENPSPERVFVMDEAGFNPAAEGGLVIGTRGYATRRIIGGYRDFFTVVICANAKGDVFCPALIMTGKLHQRSWFPPQTEEFAEVLISVSPTHNMNEVLFRSWLSVFNRALAGKVEKPVLLVVDNHSSHVACSCVEYAKSRGIHMIGLPSNTTSVFQPLDLGVFQPLKHQWRELLDE